MSDQLYKTALTNWAVVVPRLVERLLPIPEIHGSNKVNGKFCNCIKEKKINKKRPGVDVLTKPSPSPSR